MDKNQRHKDTKNKAAGLRKIFGGKKTSGQSSVSISGASSSSSRSYSFSYSSFKSLDSASRQNAVSLAEQNVRAAEERLKRAEQNLQTAQDLKHRSATNVDRINCNKSIRDVGTSGKLIDFAVNSNAIAERSVIVAEQHVKRAQEELQNAKNMLLAAKRN